jgi:hypothetical protein
VTNSPHPLKSSSSHLPVVSGFESKPEDYLYSIARDDAKEKGPLEIILIE